MNKPLNYYEYYLGGLYALLQLFVLPQLLSLANYYMQLPTWLLNVVAFSLNFICSILIYRRFLLEELKIAIAAPWRVLRYAGQGLILYYIASYLLSQLTAVIVPGFQNLNDAAVASMTLQGGALMIFATLFLVPPAEELLFRGLLFRGIYPRSPVAAWCISATAFSLIHITGYIGRYSPAMLLAAFIQYLPAGLCLCYAYVRSGTIAAPILMHLAINQIGLSIVS